MDIKTILENAIKEEEYFFHFYYELSLLHEGKIKEGLLKLSEMELDHKQKLETISIDGVYADKIDLIDVADLVLLKPLNSFKDVNGMLGFAIKQEIAAKELYKDLAEVFDGEAKELFLRLSSEEEKHEEFLCEEVQNAVE